MVSGLLFQGEREIEGAVQLVGRSAGGQWKRKFATKGGTYAHKLMIPHAQTYNPTGTN